MIRVVLRREMSRWARERAGVMTADELAGRFPRLAESETGGFKPNIKQLGDFARALHVPVNACLSLSYIRPYEMLRRERARFLLGRSLEAA